MESDTSTLEMRFSPPICFSLALMYCGTRLQNLMQLDNKYVILRTKIDPKIGVFSTFE